ncbi:hypothetical protein LPY66_11590 [Dehalobacter sp. DCM]|uniref:hypothetical protein n=1 Tax=Dehalobacter sp. DCM TaxID=2907827 RepID=UPI0030819111|nr:hypothetical protein LPY66_11590 [Dehalobacter sp. DCM]
MILRNGVSFLWYGIKNKKIKLLPFIINFLILLVAIRNINVILQERSIIVLLILLFINVFWQIIGTFSDVFRYFQHVGLDENRVKIDFEKINISEKEKELGFENVIAVENGAFVSKDLNTYLQTANEPGCCIENIKSKHVQDYIDRNFQTTFLFIKCRLQNANAGRKNFYNQKKLCLAKDIEPGAPIVFSKGCYYNTHATNKTYFSFLYDNDGQEIFSPLYRDYGDNIPSISASVMSDEIGISTIGITTDGYIVVLRQNIKANASPGLLVPTGSGSADWSDYTSGGFFQTIIAATNRELYEEVGKPKSFNAQSIAKTKIIGFFRWINMGGKPEFLSISKLNIGLNQIVPNKDEQMPMIISKYIGDQKSKKIDYETLHHFLEEIKANDKCSFPLYINILILQEYYRQHRGDFEFFLFE